MKKVKKPKKLPMTEGEKQAEAARKQKLRLESAIFPSSFSLIAHLNVIAADVMV